MQQTQVVSALLQLGEGDLTSACAVRAHGKLFAAVCFGMAGDIISNVLWQQFPGQTKTWKKPASAFAQDRYFSSYVIGSTLHIRLNIQEMLSDVPLLSKK